MNAMTLPEFERARFNMVEQQIRPVGVFDANVIDALFAVHRELFVPPAFRNLAFADIEIPLQLGTVDTRQSMLSPKLEARLTQFLQLKHDDCVLEIGTGSGFMAALLAHRAQRVISLELDAALVTQARANLQHAGIHNADVRVADGAKAVPNEGPFDVILLSGSVAEVPQNLLAQLKVGGRLVTVVGEEPVMRATIVTRTSETGFTTTHPWDTVVPRLLNFPEPSHFHF